MADDVTQRSPDEGIEAAQRSADAGIEAAQRSARAEDAFSHVPVMLDEIVGLVAGVPAGVFVDATLGGAGHADAILRSHAGLEVVGIDRDRRAIEVAAARLATHGDRVRLRRARFDRLGAILDELGIDEISGFLFDLGVSSPQLDHADRGFSYRHEGPIDMRMDPEQALSADDLVNGSDVDELAGLISRFGDERFAHRIARAIVAARPLRTTTELADVIVGAIPAPARRRGGHPAKRTFQALRIAVNGELEALSPALEAALDALGVGGRGLVLTYHSGEDRIVKDLFRERSTVTTPPGLPVPADVPEFTVLRPLARRPGPDEQAVNPRSSSARLRGIERTAERAA